MSDSAIEAAGELHPPSRARRGLSSPQATLAALAGLAGAWIAAGSAGLLAHALRRGLTCVALACAVLVAWPHVGKPVVRLGLLGVAVVVALAMISSMLAPVNVLAVAVVLLALAHGQSAAARKTILLAAEATMVLAVYRLACTSIPLVWQAADAAARLLGSAAGYMMWPWAVCAGKLLDARAGSLAQQPLSIGATFAGLDVLLTMAYLAVMVPLRSGRPAAGRRRWSKQIPFAAAVVLLGQLVYLFVLSGAAGVLSILPKSPTAAVDQDNGHLSDTLVRALHQLVPWNLPAVAVVIQLLVAGGIFIFVVRESEPPDEQTAQPASRRLLGWALLGAAVLAATLLAGLTTLSLSKPDLSGRKIVVYEEGFLNWLQPEHDDYGRLAIGMYGMLPTYLESLGAKPLVSPELSQEDLEDADALVLLYPNKAWTEEQKERIWKFVRAGGKLLVMGEHTVREDDGGDRINEILEPTAMRVRFDSATFAVGGWLQSYQALSHPTSAGISDHQNVFGVVIGASVEARPPACPLLVGRFGWADPGDLLTESMMGNHRYDAGERLGDLVLAARQPLGKGEVIVFGDTSGLTNGLTISCHPYTSRLYAYLADDASTPQTAWRQVLALLLLSGLVAILLWRPDPWRFAAVAVVLAASLVVCTQQADRLWRVLPGGSAKSPTNLAYIDASHAETFARESWRQEGVAGLAMTLMRNGYFTLTLPELTSERLLQPGVTPQRLTDLENVKPDELLRARVLVSIAPRREFTEQERQTIRHFVYSGGVFICTVGYEESGPSRSLLAGTQRRWEGSPGQAPGNDEEDFPTYRQIFREKGARYAEQWADSVGFGFHIGETQEHREEVGWEPEPLGHFKSPFFDGGDYFAYVRFHAAWPIRCDDPGALLISHYPPDVPLIVVRRYGRGLVAVVGDTCFAMNKNLEREDGSAFEGMRENAHFWRWFLTLLAEVEDQQWYPPKPPSESPQDVQPHTDVDSDREETP